MLKVERDEATKIHTVTETTVCALVEGDIESSFTKADNGVVVATDSIKNTIFSEGHQIYPAPFITNRCSTRQTEPHKSSRVFCSYSWYASC